MRDIAVRGRQKLMMRPSYATTFAKKFSTSPRNFEVAFSGACEPPSMLGGRADARTYPHILLTTRGRRRSRNFWRTIRQNGAGSSNLPGLHPND
jgi:hypothetical protein